MVHFLEKVLPVIITVFFLLLHLRKKDVNQIFSLKFPLFDLFLRDIRRSQCHKLNED